MATNDKNRIVAAVLLVLMVAAAANWYFGLIFPRYSRFIVGLISVAGAIFLSRLSPAQLGQEHTRKQNDG